MRERERERGWGERKEEWSLDRDRKARKKVNTQRKGKLQAG